MSQQGPILVVSTATRQSFASALDVIKLFPVVEAEWADAARANTMGAPAPPPVQLAVGPPLVAGHQGLGLGRPLHLRLDIGIDLHRNKFTCCVRLENGRNYLSDWKLEDLPRFVKKLRPKPRKEPIVRFEGLPGEYAQFDFGECVVPFVSNVPLSRPATCVPSGRMSPASMVVKLTTPPMAPEP